MESLQSDIHFIQHGCPSWLLALQKVPKQHHLQLDFEHYWSLLRHHQFFRFFSYQCISLKFVDCVLELFHVELLNTGFKQRPFSNENFVHAHIAHHHMIDWLSRGSRFSRDKERGKCFECILLTTNQMVWSAIRDLSELVNISKTTNWTRFARSIFCYSLKYLLVLINRELHCKPFDC